MNFIRLDMLRAHRAPDPAPIDEPMPDPQDLPHHAPAHPPRDDEPVPDPNPTTAHMRATMQGTFAILGSNETQAISLRPRRYAARL